MGKDVNTLNFSLAFFPPSYVLSQHLRTWEVKAKKSSYHEEKSGQKRK